MMVSYTVEDERCLNRGRLMIYVHGIYTLFCEIDWHVQAICWLRHTVAPEYGNKMRCHFEGQQ
jgi:hypothetical protein